MDNVGWMKRSVSTNLVIVFLLKQNDMKKCRVDKAERIHQTEEKAETATTALNKSDPSLIGERIEPCMSKRNQL